MKRALVRELHALGVDSVAELIAVDSKTYGPSAENGVRKLQKAKHLDVDGFVGKDTWAALGVHEPVTGGPQRHLAQVMHDGQVIVAAGANLPGNPISEMTLDFIKRMAAQLGKPITITTGTNHSKMTANGNISDHFSGHAVDIGMFANGGSDDSPVGDRIMEVACLTAGDSSEGAATKAHSGGLFNFNHDGERIQCIWKTNVGGNHHNHVHVGVRPQ
jgi:putative peptidoglycan binding protein